MKYTKIPARIMGIRISGLFLMQRVARGEKVGGELASN
jgi:hypothetical protein